MSNTRRKSWEAEPHWREYAEEFEPRVRSDRYVTRDGVGKPPGWEMWSRRPCSGCSNAMKPDARRIERRRNRRELERLFAEVEVEPADICGTEEDDWESYLDRKYRNDLCMDAFLGELEGNFDVQ